MPVNELSCELFQAINQMVLFTFGMDSIVSHGQGEQFLRVLQVLCHNLSYELGWSQYLSCSCVETGGP